MHKLLERQIRRHLGPEARDERLNAFLGAVDEAYQQADTDRLLLERTLDLTSEELTQRFERLREEMQHRETLLEELSQARDVAEAANRAKSSFLANMSHEIRTPLNGVLGMLEVALSEPIAPSLRELLQTARGSAIGLLHVIGDVLDLSKIEAGALEVERAMFSPVSVVAEVVETFRVAGAGRRVEVRARVHEGVPEALIGDPMRVRQVLMNLIGNAVKFTERGSVTVEVTREGDQVAIAVVDTGIGISSSKLENIFEPFVQADNTTSRRFGGTGLGLAISRRLAERMGGSLRAESEIGVGSSFTLRLPMEDPALDPGDRAPPGQILRIGAPDFRGYRILVAEDHPINQRLMVLMLARTQATVQVVNDGAAAIRTVLDHPPDLVLMDVQMPEIDGLSATRILRERGVIVPILAITAHARPEDREEAMAAGCQGWLTKPVDLERLFQALEMHLDAPATEAA